MNFIKIINDGYGKLAEKLPATDKEYLKGFKYAIECLKTFKANIDDFIEQDVPTLEKIEKELSELTIDNAVEWLNGQHDEIMVSLIDSNHYSIDEAGNIVDDGE